MTFRGSPRARIARAWLLVPLALVSCRKAPAPTESSDASSAPAPVVASSAPAASAPPETSVRGKVGDAPAPTPPEDPKKSFVDNRVAKASGGATEIVSLRVWHCGPSCTCPEPCIETVTEETGERWVDLNDEGGEKVALADWANADVTGRFTGRTRTAKTPGDEAIVIPELRLTSSPTVVSTSMGPELEGAHAKVVLEGELAKKLVPKIKDEKPWLVVAGAFPLADPGRADADASQLFEKLDKLGIKDAERHDSRAFSGLACCFDVVLGGRFADAKAADARVKQLSARGIKGYAKKGF